MNFLRLISSLLFCFFWVGSTAQINWKIQSSFEVLNIDQFQIDFFGNVYTVSENTLVGYKSSGSVISRYAAQGNGDITYLDTYNPLNLLVYYQQNSTLVFLDNQLNVQQQNFDPTWLGYQDVTLLCSTDENNIWFFDRSLNQLVKWNLGTQSVSTQSLNLKRIKDFNFSPTQLISSVDKVILNDPEVGIMIFDMTGAFEKYIPILNVSISLNGQFLYYLTPEKKLLQRNLITGIEKSINLPESDFELLEIRGDYLALYSQNSMTIYRAQEVEKH